MRVAFTELRRKRWRDVSLQDLAARYGAAKIRLDTLADPSPTPEQLLSQEVLLAMLERLIAEELTDRQWQALVAVEIDEVPLKRWRGAWAPTATRSTSYCTMPAGGSRGG